MQICINVDISSVDISSVDISSVDIRSVDISSVDIRKSSFESRHSKVDISCLYLFFLYTIVCWVHLYFLNILSFLFPVCLLRSEIMSQTNSMFTFLVVYFPHRKKSSESEKPVKIKLGLFVDRYRCKTRMGNYDFFG